jgi:hypothetical protein
MKVEPMLHRSRWLALALLLAGVPGCALYIEPGDGEGGPPAPTPLPGGGGSTPGVPTEPLPPDSTPVPLPLPPLPSSGFQMIDTADGGNADGVHTCGDAYGHYEHSAGTGTQLHVIGIYQALRTEGPEQKNGKVDVQVTRPGSSVLLLSAYEPTHWNVQVGPGAFVERIVLSGYYAQSVTAPEGAKIESYAFDEETNTWLGYGHLWPSHDTFDLVDKAQSLTGLELTSFRGCYFGDSFEIDTPVDIREPHVVSDKVEPTLPAGCEAIAGDSRYCLSMQTGKPVAIGLQSGALCLSEMTGLAGGFGASLGWRGDYAYGCIYERGLARVSLVDGSTDIAPISCDAVAVHGDDLLVMPFGSSGFEEYPLYSVLRFDDFAAAARREVADAVEIFPSASRMAVDGDRGYFAWHATNTIETAELTDGAEMTTITLEGYDDWIYGLEAIDGMLIVAGPYHNPGLHAFDAATGAALGVLLPEFTGDGLTCVSNVL